MANKTSISNQQSIQECSYLMHRFDVNLIQQYAQHTLWLIHTVQPVTLVVIR